MYDDYDPVARQSNDAGRVDVDMVTHGGGGSLKERIQYAHGGVVTGSTIKRLQSVVNQFINSPNTKKVENKNSTSYSNMQRTNEDTP